MNPMTELPSAASPEHFVNRELSLLDFQKRVLAIAEDSSTPLLERLRFVAIVVQNLDEFFQVRVAGIQNQIAGRVTTRTFDGMTPADQMAAIRIEVSALFERIDSLFTDDLAPHLQKEGIHLLDYEDLSVEDIEQLEARFEAEVFPVLTPLAVDPAHPFPYISNLSLNLAVVVRDPHDDDLQFARIKVPPLLPRFVPLGDHRYVRLESVMARNVDRLFPAHPIVDAFAFRVTRSADLAVEEEEADDLLEAMESVLRFRQRSASAIRLEVDPGASAETLDLLIRELDLEEDHVYHRNAPLDLSALFELVAIDRPELKDSPWTPTTNPRFSSTSEHDVDFFEEIRGADILVHHPYESFATSTGAFLAQAAADPDVLAIKQTLYRTSASEDPALGGEEEVVRSLIAAAEAGKQVVVLVELKARFDEAANITWAKMLENAGAHVVYGVVGLKTHARILLVVRREQEGLRRYAHIGTGNYNPKTARLYEDLGMFTADPDLGRDLSELFNTLTGYGTPTSYRRLLVAPSMLRSRITERIREEAAKGAEGRILFKINHIVDPHMITELYAASLAGCQIDLIVRGICSLRAGVPGLSPTIRVRSIVGRFLEHSRIYRFGDPSHGAVYYTGSADLMTRNLDGRVEALTPVVDARLKARLEELLDILMTDDTQAWQLDDDRWTKVETSSGVASHPELQARALARKRLEDWSR
jgi:polyphosphate kinase